MNKLLSKSLSNVEILDYLNGDTVFYTYPNFIEAYDKHIKAGKPINNLLRKLFKGKKSICFLYLETADYGHWCCLLNKKKIVDFFDSYGRGIDYYNKEYPVLAKMMIKSNYEIHYNNHKYQEEKKGINTCGRHVIIRIMCYKLTDEAYKKLMDYLKKNTGLNYDKIVTLLTYDI